MLRLLPRVVLRACPPRSIRGATSAAKASQLASTAPGEPVDQKLAEDLVLSLQPRELPQVLQPFAAAAFMPPELWTGLAPEVPKCMEQLTEMQLVPPTGTIGDVDGRLAAAVGETEHSDREVHHDPFPRLVPLKPFGGFVDRSPVHEGLLELHEATSDVPRLLGAELLEPLAELGYVAVRGTLGARVSVEQWRRRRRRGRRS
ncbi:unnamed protein product [Durusdinium trenchii]|uniref:Uncharacterized protein n=1 Tax=Durusdinium trenchii TaxID=1381693 RepID=A0ABP0JW08_9DINO